MAFTLLPKAGRQKCRDRDAIVNLEFMAMLYDSVCQRLLLVLLLIVVDMTNQPKLLGVAHLNAKSQVVIPKEAREFLGIGPGDRVLIVSAPFRKALILTRPEDMEEQLNKFVSNSQKTINAMHNKLNK